MCYSICSVGTLGQQLAGEPAFDVPFRLVAPVSESARADATRGPSIDLYLQEHSVITAALVPALLSCLAPIDKARTAQLSAELTSSTTHGALASRAEVGFAHDGARSGYVKLNVASRSKQLGLALLLEPNIVELIKRTREVPFRVASFGGGPGESALALALCRSHLGLSESVTLNIAVLDIENGWRDCVGYLDARMREASLLNVRDQVWFGKADVTRSLDDGFNEASVPVDQWHLIIFSYVLVENSDALTNGGNFAFLRDLFTGMRPGASCVILDSSTRLRSDYEALASEYVLRVSFPRPARGFGRMELSNVLVLSKPPLATEGVDVCTS